MVCIKATGLKIESQQREPVEYLLPVGKDASGEAIAAVPPEVQCVFYFLMGGNVMFLLVLFAE